MFNQFTGIGNLSADPESRFTQNGTQVANFTVCCESGYGDKKQTEFVRCIAWDKLAKICADYFRKGNRVFIQGVMQTRKWTDKNQIERYTTEIVLRDAKNLSPRAQDGAPTPPPFDDHGRQNSTGEQTPF